MEKKKQQLIITGALLVVMVIMMTRALFFSGKGRAGQAPAAASSSVPGVSTETMTANMTFLAMIQQNESARLLQEAYWEKAWTRDPFALSRSTDGPELANSDFVLSGIVWDERMPVAIINQKLMKAGDTADGCLVKEIRRSSVTIVCDDKPFDLQLFRSQAPPAEGDTQAKP